MGRKSERQKNEENRRKGEELRNCMEDLDMVEPWRNCMGNKREYTWGHVGMQNRAANPLNIKGTKKVCIPERRIDYVLINKKEQNICVDMEILEQGEVGWETDHKAIKTKIIGLAAIRRAAGSTWQRKTFYMNKFKGVVEDRVCKELDGWTKVGLTGKNRLNWLTKKVQKTLAKEVGRREQWKPVPRVVPKSDIATQYRKEIIEIRELLSKKEIVSEEMVGWIKRERELCSKLGVKSTAETKTSTRTEEECEDISVIRWTLQKKWDVLRKKLRLEEENAIRIKYRNRASVKMMGENYTPWATYMWKMGKKIARKEEDIKVLRDRKDSRLRTDEGVLEVMEDYMKEMWGKSEKLQKITLSNKMGGRKQCMNSSITEGEVMRAIKKLKEQKAPGEDLIPNEVWMVMDRVNIKGITEALEECRMNNEFPKGWKRTDLRWIYKKGDPTEVTNYRPIALTDTMYKIFMRIMTERLEKKVELENIVSDEQQGFRKDRSCYGAVMALKLKMARCLRDKKPMHVAYLDISKAYDSVNHEQLWNMQGVGIEW